MKTEVPPLSAASVMVIRDAPLEVLMLRRHEKSSFVPNAWVFPGGIAEAADSELARELSDGTTLATMRITAARETFEESGVWLGRPLERQEQKRKALIDGTVTLRDLLREAPLEFETLVWTSRWITPVGMPKRFDTWFFLAKVSRDVVATAEQNEAVEVTWISPAGALSRHEEGSMQMVFPTLRNLEAIAGYENVDALIESRRDAVIEPVLPVLVGGKPTIP